ncbi:MAG: UDP-N-acetylglucosamine diphosphorylase/glucosamine-1-phosphate N-acetyltransferase [Chloroflexi bacterium]|nr:UDP-N-acetylglucosamine diphosphorylase/glucosamine-1-phosphate N-acetyltransferase [Chloroflexota bacterium]
MTDSRKRSRNFGAVVLAAGMGTRMKSRTPKPLHQICGRPMMLLVTDAVRNAGIEDIALVVPPDDKPFRDALDDTAQYATQSEPLGTGHALLQAQYAMRGADNVLALYGDVPLIRASTLAALMQQHIDSDAVVTLITSQVANPKGMGRIVRDDNGSIRAIVEERDVDRETRAISEVNSGFYCFRADWLWDNLANLTPAPNGELLLTDIIHAARAQGLHVASTTPSVSNGESSSSANDPHEMMGVNDRTQLAQAEVAMRRRINDRLMLDGVTMPDAASVYIDYGVSIGQDTTVLPNTHIKGETVIGIGCTIGPSAIIENATIGDDCEILSSVVRDSTLAAGVDVGPFSHIRGGARIGSSVHIGTSAEVKNSRIGRGTKMGHFSYMGDATLGENVNIGAGAITCNFDGKSKHETVIGRNAFIGSDTMLVAPVNIGDGASTGAGAVVTKDVPGNALVVGVPAREL